MVKKIETIVIKVKQETYDVKTIRFDLKDNPMDFKPGQFITIFVDVDINGEKTKQSRPFSISSSPNNKEFIEISVKVYPDSVTAKAIHNLKEGDIVTIMGPGGRFIYDESKGRNLVLLAGGNGVTPLRSITHYVLDNNLDVNVTLIYSNKTPEDIIFRKEIDELTKKHKNFKRIFTITRVNESKSKWDGNVGRINAELIRSSVEELSSAIFYVAGPPQMVEDIVNVLKDLGIEDFKIHAEEFVRGTFKK